MLDTKRMNTMTIKSRPTDTTQPTPAVTVTSKPKILKTYPIIALVASPSGGPSTVREIKISARNKKQAELLATGLVVFLDSAQVRAITTEYTGCFLNSGLVLKVG